MLQIIADELKQARIKKDITVKQISIKTRIEQKYLENIEDGNFSFMPELYVKAFIKQFADSVDLNPERIIQRYELAKRGINPDSIEDKATEQITTLPDEDEDKPKLKEPIYIPPNQSKKVIDAFEIEPEANKKNPKPSNNNLIFIGAGVLIVVLILSYFLFIKEKNLEIITERPFDEVLEEEKSRFIEETPEEKFSTPSDSLSVLIKGISVSWVQASIDEKDTIEFTLYEGIVRELKAGDNIKFKIGNSAGVTIEANGKPLSFEGRPNQVTNIKIDKNGLQLLR